MEIFDILIKSIDNAFVLNATSEKNLLNTFCKLIFLVAIHYLTKYVLAEILVITIFNSVIIIILLNLII